MRLDKKQYASIENHLKAKLERIPRNKKWNAEFYNHHVRKNVPSNLWSRYRHTKWPDLNSSPKNPICGRDGLHPMPKLVWRQCCCSLISLLTALGMLGEKYVLHENPIVMQN
jgi:hypothetical protein